MRIRKVTLAIHVLASLSTLPAWMPAQAAELEEVRVVARRVEERLQDVPLAVTAFSGADLEKAGIAQLRDIVQAIPSVQDSPQIGRRNANMWAIRGQKADDVLLTQDPAVAVYVGDVVQGWPYGLGTLGSLDIKSLEVIKGPVGTLFGRNSTGGAIVITPNEPSDKFEGVVKVGGGSDALATVEGMINVPVNDQLAVRVAAEYGRRDGLIENLDVPGHDYYDRDSWTIRSSLKWQPTDRLSTLLVFDAFHAEDNGSALKLIRTNPAVGFGRAYQNALDRYRNDDFFSVHSDPRTPGFSDYDVKGISNTTIYDVNDALTVKNVVAYRYVDLIEVVNSSGANPVHVNAGAGPIFRYSPNITQARQISEEAQLIGKLDRLDWIAGLYYFNVGGTDISRSVSFNTNERAQTQGPQDFTNESFAGFIQGTYHITDRWNFTAGFRYTTDNREMTTIARNFTIAGVPIPLVDTFAAGVRTGPCLLQVANPVTPTARVVLPIAQCSLTQNATFSEPTWTFSLDYKPTEDQIIYIAHRHGYRSGGLPGRGQTPEGLAPFAPETINDFEVGYKGDLTVADTQLRVATAFFYQELSDMQRSRTFVAPSGFLTNTVVNAAAATITGVELELNWLPTDSLEISGFFSYLDAGYDEWTDAFASGPLAGQTFDRSANLFQGIPEHSGGATVRYRLPVGDGYGGVFVSGNVYTQGRYALSNDNLVDNTNRECIGAFEDGYTTVNVRVDWEGVLGNPKWDASFWGKNVTNREYFVNGLCQSNGLGVTWAAPGEPATYGVTLSYRFGE